MTLPSARALSRSIFEGSNGPVSGAAEADRPTLMRAGPAASAFSTVRRGNFCIVYLPFAALHGERHACRHIAGDPLGITPAIGTEPQRARVEGLHVNVRTSIPFRTREIGRDGLCLESSHSAFGHFAPFSGEARPSSFPERTLQGPPAASVR